MASEGIDSPALRERPEIPVDLQWIWQGWRVLQFSRPIGWGPGHIPLSEIESYGRIYHFTDEDLDLLIYFVYLLDAEFLKQMSEKEEKNARY